MKVAVIFESSPFDRKGLFNAVHNRIIHLKKNECVELDVFCIHSKDTPFSRKVRHTPDVPWVDKVVIEGVRYKLLWYDFSILDYLLVEKLHKPPVFFKAFIDRYVSMLQTYDYVIAHSFTGALFAYEAKKRYGIKYCVTWHGSDVHTHPHRNPMIMEDTRRIMLSASCNFYVSKALMLTSDNIEQNVRKEVLYNGVAESFTRYPDHKRKELRKKYGLDEDDKVVAFVGSIVAVKNVTSLQPYFSKVSSLYGASVKFWMVGDGKLRASVEKSMKNDRSLNVRFWGNVPANEMPDVMNCIDVLVLPSLNEGLGMVTGEAIRCGAYAIGSDVGGISEVVGKDYVVPLGLDFIDRLSELTIDVLKQGKDMQYLPDEMDWARSAAKELSVIMEA